MENHVSSHAQGKQNKKKSGKVNWQTGKEMLKTISKNSSISPARHATTP